VVLVDGDVVTVEQGFVGFLWDRGRGGVGNESGNVQESDIFEVSREAEE